jgi:hypothetical protein
MTGQVKPVQFRPVATFNRSRHTMKNFVTNYGATLWVSGAFVVITKHGVDSPIYWLFMLPFFVLEGIRPTVK